jgi:hypothetical protein
MYKGGEASAHCSPSTSPAGGLKSFLYHPTPDTTVIAAFRLIMSVLTRADWVREAGRFSGRCRRKRCPIHLFMYCVLKYWTMDKIHNLGNSNCETSLPKLHRTENTKQFSTRVEGGAVTSVIHFQNTPKAIQAWTCLPAGCLRSSLAFHGG